MPIVNVTLPSDGTGADVGDYNPAILAILAVLNGHIASDNIEPGSLDWSVMSGTMTNVIPSTAMQDSGSAEKFRDEANIGFTASGLVWSALTGLNATMTAGIQYTPDGLRRSVSAVTSRAFTVSKDTYVSISPAGALSYQEVANNAAQPALTNSDYRWLAKVVTSASAITSVTDMRQTGAIGPQNIDWAALPRFSAYSNSTVSITNTTLVTPFNQKLFDNYNAYNTSTYAYTIPMSGYYQVNTQVWMGSAGAGSNEACNIQMRVNNSTVNMPESERMNGSDNANRLLRPKISTIMYFNAGDTVQVASTFVTVGSRDIVGSQADTWFNMYLISK